MQDRIAEVVCGGVTEYQEYLLNQLARMVQSPYLQGEVAARHPCRYPLLLILTGIVYLDATVSRVLVTHSSWTRSAL
jgi:hypothetical protein